VEKLWKSMRIRLKNCEKNHMILYEFLGRPPYLVFLA
jgi:hypothetical protein